MPDDTTMAPALGPPNPSTTEARVSTGNSELDTILSGGLVAHRPYLVVGPSGTGKTKLALQFLCEGVRRGEKVLLITLEDPPNEMLVNHRALSPDLDQLYVFDAIPDVMRYERAPFKDIAAVRASIQFADVPLSIRQTAELVSVEVTFSALEQTLKMEMARRNFQRLAVDSLTALQYFCMKGIDETLGAQTFLRFLSDLKVTTLLTVESPVEEIETPERLLARGEIRLFRWELEGRTVRAIGVEKFRGSSHDVRLHPYRINSTGLSIDLRSTISRDTRRIIDPSEGNLIEGSEEAAPVRPLEVGQLLSDMSDLASLGIEVRPAQDEILAMRVASEGHHPDEVALHLLRARAIISELAQQWNPEAAAGADRSASDRAVRIADGATDQRAGGLIAPVVVPPAPAIEEIARRSASLEPAPPPSTTPIEGPKEATDEGGIGPVATTRPDDGAGPGGGPSGAMEIVPRPPASDARSARLVGDVPSEGATRAGEFVVDVGPPPEGDDRPRRSGRPDGPTVHGRPPLPSRGEPVSDLPVAPASPDRDGGAAHREPTPSMTPIEPGPEPRGPPLPGPTPEIIREIAPSLPPPRAPPAPGPDPGPSEEAGTSGPASPPSAPGPRTVPPPVIEPVVGPPAPAKRAAPRRRRTKSSGSAEGGAPTKRRTSSRRKAPPVTAATPGTPPPEAATDASAGRSEGTTTGPAEPPPAPAAPPPARPAPPEAPPPEDGR